MWPISPTPSPPALRCSDSIVTPPLFIAVLPLLPGSHQILAILPQPLPHRWYHHASQTVLDKASPRLSLRTPMATSWHQDHFWFLHGSEKKQAFVSSALLQWSESLCHVTVLRNWYPVGKNKAFGYPHRPGLELILGTVWRSSSNQCLCNLRFLIYKIE